MPFLPRSYFYIFYKLSYTDRGSSLWLFVSLFRVVQLLEVGKTFSVISVAMGPGHTPATEWRLYLTPLQGPDGPLRGNQATTEVLRSPVELPLVAIGGLRYRVLS